MWQASGIGTGNLSGVGVQWCCSDSLPPDQAKFAIPDVPMIGLLVNSFGAYFMMGINSTERKNGPYSDPRQPAV